MSNSAKLQAKRGRGRPRKNSGSEDYEVLGPPPCSDLLDLAEWAHRVAATTALQTLRNRGSADTRAGLRVLASAIGKLLPPGLAGQGIHLDASKIDPDEQPPDDPLARSVWLARVLAEEMRLTIEGKSSRARRKELCAVATAMGKVLPPDAYHKAREILREERADDAFERASVDAVPLQPGRPKSLNLPH
jgi:hypothetical protein